MVSRFAFNAAKNWRSLPNKIAPATRFSHLFHPKSAHPGGQILIWTFRYFESR
jgi:hypothetical protein